MPNLGLVAQLVNIGEWVVGLSLTLGLAVRVGALSGMWLNLNYMLMKGLASGGGSIDRLFFLNELMFLVVSAGLVWGLDGVLRRAFARTPVARWLVGPAPGARPAPTG